ncbi:GFA family protein [Sphingomonas metalli]|uniref:GFA family protein n=1 Tax=Sphingomonas metalli TaxID=1779358 RepID=UPI001E427E3D|nr:GFA family protein [Sphingomonas metalli]
MTRTAACSCGQLRITVGDQPLRVGLCHCTGCQRRTGSVFATQASFAPPWHVEGRWTELRRTGDAGSLFRFHFCPVCGTTLFHREAGQEERRVSVAVGAFADGDFRVRPSRSTTVPAGPGSRSLPMSFAMIAIRNDAPERHDIRVTHP